MLKIGHRVKVPLALKGGKRGRHNSEIPVPESLETTPGIPQDPQTVDFYSRNFPLESDNVANGAYWRWDWDASDIAEAIHENWAIHKSTVKAAYRSGDLEPTAVAEPNRDVTRLIKQRALELGFSMVGITGYDHRYTYESKRDWVKPFPHAICLAMEQPFGETQKIPQESSERAVFVTYRRMGVSALELGDYIRSLGYHAQVHDTYNDAAPVIPMFVAAGMGQVGASGYLLSPQFGSRVRLMIMTTDALVSHDRPVDYGVHAFCSICQVCVNRCPGRALTREKVWWRGVEKHKIIGERCRPVMSRYSMCGVCMKVCPIQRFGLKPVMEHYAATAQVLGKGTHGLEGYAMAGLGYFGPGDLPTFESSFFDIPSGTMEQRAVGELLTVLKNKGTGSGPHTDTEAAQLLEKLRESALEPNDFTKVQLETLG